MNVGRSCIDRALVICPTEFGGHIEHAADTALALLEDPDIEHVTLLSRPGARAYLGISTTTGLVVDECLPPSRPERPGWQKPIRAALQVVDLVREHLVIRRRAGNAGSSCLLVLDSTKYPLPSVLRGHAEQPVCLFVHNARPHSTAGKSTLRSWFIVALSRSCVNRADRVITHGAAQREILAATTRTEVTSVRLPRTTRLDVPSDGSQHSVKEDAEEHATAQAQFALCIGEIRANKGVDLAMIAAARGGIPLRVHGRSESPVLTAKLQELASASETIVLEDRFLDRAEFDHLVESAAVVVLPYVQFDAHSGVLSRAMRAHTYVVAADLPSLRGQAEDYPLIRFVDVHDIDVLSTALRQSIDDSGHREAQQARDVPSTGPLEGHADWDAVVQVLVATTRKRSSNSYAER